MTANNDKTTCEDFLATVVFERARREHYNEILDLCINQFVKSEPHCRALGITAPACTPVYEYLVNKCLECPYSIIAKDKASGEIIGIRLMSIGHRNSDSEKNLADFVQQDRNCLIMEEMLNSVKQMMFDALPDVHTVLRREVSLVIPKFQGKGLGSKMIELGLDYDDLRKQGIQGIASEAASLTNQRLLKKNGFKLLGQLDESYYSNNNIVLDDGTRTIEAVFKDIRK